MKKITRRAFLISGSVIGGGLLVGYLAWPERRPSLKPGPGESLLNAWLKIGEDGSIIVVSPYAEMGQGIYTSVAMLVAEELEVDWAHMSVEAAPVDPIYVNVAMVTGGLRESETLPEALEGIGLGVVGGIVELIGVQGTGGSSSIRDAHEKLRRAGAAARAMLLDAAALRWKVDADECRAELGHVYHEASGRSASYGALASGAALLSPPSKPKLKDPAEYRIIGRPMPRLDIPAKVDGSAEFGIDVRYPDMSYAAIRMPERIGGRIKSHNADALEGLPGIQAVVSSDSALAVVAGSYWEARQALEKVEIEFDDGAGAGVDSPHLIERFGAALKDGEAHVYRDEGDVDAVFEDLTLIEADAPYGQIVEARYRVPYLAHACMEPMNCTAWVRGGSCEIHMPTQMPTLVRDVAAAELGIEKEQVTVLTTFLGGGFGRRLEADLAQQAVAISRKVKRPVQVIWSREDDIRHDFYRPMTMARMRAVLDGDGLPMALVVRGTGQSVAGAFMDRWYPDFASHEPDPASVDGLANTPYEIANRRVEHVVQREAVPVGSWRSVGNSFSAFFMESFIDELAVAGGHDPFALRRRLLAGHPRFLRVLDELESLSNFHGPKEGQIGRGLAIHRSFGSIVGEVAEVQYVDGAPRVKKVSCVIDCGNVVNPDTVAAQMESGIIYGLTAALYGRITFEDGRPMQSNFHDYEMLRMAEAPEIEVRIVESGARRGGVGEPATPPIAPAVCNAIYDATGLRIRDLPILRAFDGS